jgi:large subunit ribosomal protein L23
MKKLNLKCGPYQAHQILLAPIMSEKSVNLKNAVAFWVHDKATKQDIAAAVEKVFNVSVRAVRTVNNRFYSSRVRLKAAPVRIKRKAYVTLAEGQTLDLSSI